MAVLAFSAYPQIDKTLQFIPEGVDFGTIREESGMASQKVKAVNISADTTFIISARTSCGCSAVDFSEQPIAPGDTTEVTITYDPTNRPGKFLKTARFFTGNERIGNSIKIRGTVIPSPSNLDKAYPDKAGALRLSTLLINAGEISRKEARPFFVGIYNDSDRPIKLTADTDAAALESTFAPDSIEPFGIATLTMMLKGRLIKDNETEFSYRTYIMDAATGDTLVSIPVGGTVKTN